MNKTLTEWIIENKYARNEPHARRMIAGLQLNGLDRLAQEERVKLYRDWRKSGVFGKDTVPCFEQAIKGNKPPMLEVAA